VVKCPGVERSVLIDESPDDLFLVLTVECKRRVNGRSRRFAGSNAASLQWGAVIAKKNR